MKKYACYMECTEWERLDISEIFYEVKEMRLIEIDLDNWYIIRQWKDLTVDYKDQDNWTFHMEYWMLYCSNWGNIESVWHWRWEDDLKARIETCENYI